MTVPFVGFDRPKTENPRNSRDIPLTARGPAQAESAEPTDANPRVLKYRYKYLRYKYQGSDGTHT